jgi:hypothetical protein
MHTKVERMFLNGGKGGAVDVLDLFIHADGPLARWYYQMLQQCKFRDFSVS